MDSQIGSNRVIDIHTSSKVEWIMKMNAVHQLKKEGHEFSKSLLVSIDHNVKAADLEPFHIVLISCLTEYLSQYGCNVTVMANDELVDFLADDLKLEKYFDGKTVHVEGRSDFHNGLWKVSPESFSIYSYSVAKYLKRTYFDNLDESPIKVALDEIYANIADHSKSGGVAYSFISYDKDRRVIRAAFCDFGVGIHNSLKKSGIKDCDEWIKLATERGVTAKSNTHNMGFGLDAVIGCCTTKDGTLCIISGKELYICKNNRNQQRTFHLDFDFDGTLIYFNLPVASLDSDELLTETLF